MLADKYNVKYTKKTPASVILDGLPVQVQREFRIPKMMGGKIKKKKLSPGGRAISDGDSEGGRSLSDAEQKFIAKIKKQIAQGESGKSISDGDQVKFMRLQKIMGKVVTPFKDVYDTITKPANAIMKKITGKASGGKIKKTYAMGGGIRKANYK